MDPFVSRWPNYAMCNVINACLFHNALVQYVLDKGGLHL